MQLEMLTFSHPTPNGMRAFVRKNVNLPVFVF